MSVKVHLHLTLRRFSNGQETVDVEGNTVGECLKGLVKKFPDMAGSLFDKKGKLLNIVEVFVNLESAYPNELAKPVKDGDDIHLTLMLAGG
ncbi:MAG: ThiS family protein [Pseudomonadota bacterium]